METPTGVPGHQIVTVDFPLFISLTSLYLLYTSFSVTFPFPFPFHWGSLPVPLFWEWPRPENASHVATAQI